MRTLLFNVRLTPRRALTLVFGLGAVFCLVSGCGQSPSAPSALSVPSQPTRGATHPPPTQPKATVASMPQNYRNVRGQVVLVVPANKAYPHASLVIAHEAIPKFMAAMSMSFPLRNAKDAQRLKKGDKIRFDLVLHGGSLFVENVRLLSANTVLQITQT